MGFYDDEKGLLARHRPRSPLSPSFRPRMRRRAPQKLIYVATTVVLVFFLFYTHHGFQFASSEPTSSRASKQTSNVKTTTSGTLPCRSLPGADDVLVVLKTGSTELQDKLPIHLNTTLRCYPHYMLFSDYEESFAGEHIHDALEFVSPDIKAEHPDFELWRRLQKGGRAALRPQELSGPLSRNPGDLGKKDNPGWNLDKWKFLPMVNRTLNAYPDKKWYVFVETDTYVLWQTLLNYLSALDWEEPIYMGAQIYIGDILFAHGGSGFAASRTALEKVVKMFQQKQHEWETFTSYHWAGDAVLGKAFNDTGTPLHQVWPIWQGDDPGQMTWAREERGMRMWCRPTVSFHHIAPPVVEELWEFEQEWISTKAKDDPSLFLRHHDLFAQFVLPRLSEARVDWDNHASEDRGPVRSLEACQRICEQETECLQYSLSLSSRCLIATLPNLGEWSKGIESGWRVDRIKNWMDDMVPCTKDQSDWLYPF